MLVDKIKSFASDTLTYGTFQVLGRLFTFLLTPLYSNYLSATENGIIAYLFSIQVFALFVYIFGMEATYFRFFSKDNEIHNKKVFTTAYLIISSIGILFSLILLLFSSEFSSILITDNIPHTNQIFQLVCLIPLFDCLVVVPYSRMRMERRTKEFAITRFLIIVISVALSAYFVIFTSLGVRGVFLGQVIASGIALIYLFPQIVKMLDFNLDKQIFKDMLKFGVPLIPSNLSIIALQVADRPIMKLLISSAEIGIYQINAKLAVPMLMFVSIFDTAWKPFFLSHFEDSDAKTLFSKILTYYIFVSFLLLIVISFFMDYIVRIPLWDNRTFVSSYYWQGLDVVSLIVLGYLINGITTNIASVFHIDKKTKYISMSAFMSAVISISLNFILVPLLGYTGAAISLVCGYFIGMVSMKFWTKKSFYKIEYEWKRIAIIIILSAIALFLGKYIALKFDLTIAFFIKLFIIVAYLLVVKRACGFTKITSLFNKQKL